MNIKATLLALTAIAALPAIAHAQGNPPINFCSGVAGGNYAFTGTAIRQQLPDHITTQNTPGSMTNLDFVSKGVCQATIAQIDAYYVFEQQNAADAANVEIARDMYPEAGHLVCNKSIGAMSDLKAGDTVILGGEGSGSPVTWDAVVRANPAKYKDVQTLPMNSIDRALGKVRTDEAKCMLFVAGLRSKAMIDANTQAKAANGNLHLATMRDPHLFDLKDKKNRPIYTRTTIPDGTYPDGLQNSGWFTSGAVDTIEVMSVMVDNVPYAEKHEKQFDIFLKAVEHAMPAIRAQVLPK